ncbi:MAG TPA: hypothetical protein QGF58_00825 [Myxococcota bacterium]|nr:hypothetical protein [Myxococcota bacterium]
MMWIASAWAMPAADLCVEPAPVPDPLPDRTHIDPMDPPGPLFPVEWETLEAVEMGGEWYDALGRVYAFASVREVVGEATRPTFHAPEDFYTGEYKVDGFYGFAPSVSTAPVAYAAHRGQCPSTANICYTPKDDEAWRLAADIAKGMNAPLIEWGETPYAVHWAAVLCAYNNAAEKRILARDAAEKSAQDATSVRDALASDVPMAAFALSNGLYRDLDIEPPTDDAAKAADARAVWGAVQRLGGTDAVAEFAAAGTGSLAERLTIPPVESPATDTED